MDEQKIYKPDNLSGNKNEFTELITLQEASNWASKLTNKEVTLPNITYLIQYGLIKKHNNGNGITLVSRNELREYYNSRLYKRQVNWKKKLGNDINWHLSFENVKEAETTKHVHRLHPYKGKFIPQLVEYFLDENVDEFKTNAYFHPGDIILDPFCGSGTTLVQANELGINALGIDISSFNSLISNIKVGDVDLNNLNFQIKRINKVINKYVFETGILKFDQKLLMELNKFNQKYFPSPDFKYKAKRGEIDVEAYGKKHETIFLKTYNQLVQAFRIEFYNGNTDSFLGKWYIKPILNEINLVLEEIEKTDDPETKNILRVILSRTIRSCRATTHSDLVTLKEPMVTTYFCAKHGKICKPLFTILQKWLLYSSDTVKRFVAFNQVKTATKQICITGDSRKIDIVEEIEKINLNFAKSIRNNKIKGIFTSPPYVGLIDYHEQHAYAYELFGFQRKDDLEIGPLQKGRSKQAQENYIQGISEVLVNCKKYLQSGYDVFLVANDKNNLYPKIADNSGMTIVNEFKRPVLNRSERDKSAYAESIFHLREKNHGYKSK
ncbi:MAG: restriction endonuclease subunit M [Chloroflexi bacterium 44-23]|nr:MAG: restriction endonuclease subunit M [Chloroflexi bacterium 44-23]